MKKFLFSVLSICMVLSLVTVASATVLNFDDITQGSWDTISDGYGGFNWTNSEAVVEGYAGYYTESAVSDFYAFDNASGLTATVVSQFGTFDFLGAWFSPANAAQPGTIIVEAFAGGSSQGTQSIILTDSATPVWVDFGPAFTGIDELVFTPTTGGHPAYWAMDDFTYTSSVPVPAAVWLLGSGLLGLVGYRRKRTV